MINTALFGTLDIDPETTIRISTQLEGHGSNMRYILLQSEDHVWLQCVDEPDFAVKVDDPFSLDPAYDPSFDDSLLAPLGSVSGDNMFVLVPLAEKDTARMNAPLIINTDTMVGIQITL